MDNALLDLSATAEISEREIEELETKIDHKEIQARFFLTEAQKQDLHEAFDLLDYNGEGKIRAEDFRVAIKALGYEPTKEELQNMINGVDKGQTGKLSFENFETAIMRKVMSLDSDGDIMKSFRLFDMDDTEVEDMTLEDKCEHLMNVVVESRKRFGKMCIDYEQKTSLVENKMLNLQIETISNYRFKSKTTIPSIDFESMEKDLDEFKDTLVSNQKRIDELKRNISNTENVVMQLKLDAVGQRLKKPLTVEAMLADAKKKIKS